MTAQPIRHSAPANTECDYCEDPASAVFIESLPMGGTFSYRTCNAHAVLFTGTANERALAESFISATRAERLAGRAFRDRMADGFGNVIVGADWFGAAIDAMTEDRFCDLPMPGDPAPYRRTAERVRIYGPR